MNEKNNGFYFIAVFFAFILGGAIGGVGTVIYTAHKSDNRGIEQYQQRERELLGRITDYQQRENARIEAERIRIARENERIRAERERIARTEAQLRTIWGLDRRSSDLLSELAKEIDILADFFFSTRNQYTDNIDNNNSEVK